MIVINGYDPLIETFGTVMKCVVRWLGRPFSEKDEWEHITWLLTHRQSLVNWKSWRLDQRGDKKLFLCREKTLLAESQPFPITLQLPTTLDGYNFQLAEIINIIFFMQMRTFNSWVFSFAGTLPWLNMSPSPGLCVWPQELLISPLFFKSRTRNI